MSLEKAIIKLHGDLTGRRVNWDAHWQEVTDFVIPRKNNVFGGKTPGEKKTNAAPIYDGTAIQGLSLLSSALHGMLTNPANVWLAMTTGIPELDNIPRVRDWMQKAAKKIDKVLNDSNFQTEIHEVYNDLGSLGTAVLRMEEDKDLFVRFHARPIYEHYVQENFKGFIDTISRTYELKGRQIEQEFDLKKVAEGLDVLEKDKLKKLEEDPLKVWEIIHLVLPKKDAEKMSKKKYRMPFVSFKLIKDLELLVSESGFEEFPYAVPRWTKTSGEMYGRSPSMQALPDIKMINQMMKTTIRAAQKVVDPPLQVPDDGVLLPLRTIPGGINYYRAGTGDRIEPLRTEGRIDLGQAIMEDVRARIREAFFIDQLQLQEGPQMTATEVLQRTEEKLRLMGPVLGRQHFELLKPIFERVFGILLRRNELPDDIPPELVDLKLDVKFSSMISRAQRAVEADNLQRVIGAIAPVAEAQPDISDNIDGDKYLKHVSGLFDVPEEIFRDPDEVQEIRASRAKRQEEAEETQLNNVKADSLKKAGDFI